MKKCLLLILLIFAFFYSLQAQVDPLYAQYLNNPVLINPAYTGLNNNLFVAASYRKQWAGFDGSPSTMNLNGHLSLFNNKVGLGCLLLQDNVGNNQNTEAYTTYAYKILTRDGILSFGLQSGFVQYRMNNNELNPYDRTDPAFNADQRVTKFSFGAGVAYKSDRIFVGLSVPRLLKHENSLGDVMTDLYSQHLYFQTAYIFFLSERIRFKPSILLRAVEGAPLSCDYNLFFNLDDKLTAGLYTRNLNALGALLQVKLGTPYMLGYSYEVPTNRSVGTRFSTHEFVISMNLNVLSFHESSIKSF